MEVTRYPSNPHHHSQGGGRKGKQYNPLTLITILKEVEERVNKMQRKFMLNEQLKIIKKELGIEKDDKQSLIDKFNDRIKDKTLPANIAEVRY